MPLTCWICCLILQQPYRWGDLSVLMIEEAEVPRYVVRYVQGPQPSGRTGNETSVSDSRSTKSYSRKEAPPPSLGLKALWGPTLTSLCGLGSCLPSCPLHMCCPMWPLRLPGHNFSILSTQFLEPFVGTGLPSGRVSKDTLVLASPGPRTTELMRAHFFQCPSV